MEDIHSRIACQQNKMKLYMEVADKPIYGKVHICNIFVFQIFFFFTLN
jgi:hypothetical protein